jgi:hypothetical protein
MLQAFVNGLQTFAVNCAPKAFFGIEPWYKYLYAAGRITGDKGSCELTAFQYSDITLIALAVLDMVLRIAGIVAVGYVVYGGIQYVMSQGEPDKSKMAQQTIVNALIGLAITIIAAATVSFIGNRLG